MSPLSRNSLSRPGLTALVALAVVLASSSVPHAQREQRERAMFVSVLDHDGAPVGGLTPADFIIREDDAQREVLRVERATTPIEFTVLVDTSETATPVIADVRRALTEFIAEVVKGKKNTMAITAFGGPPRVLQNYTSNTALLEKTGVGGVFAESGSGAYLLDGLMSVADGIRKRAPERPVIIVVLVRGSIEFSNVQHQVVVEALRSCGAAFHAVSIQTRADAPTAGDLASTFHEREIVLDEASRGTGGRNDLLLTGLAVGGEMKAIATELANQYRVVYARPESLIPPKNIDVSVKKPGLTARGTPVGVQR